MGERRVLLQRAAPVLLLVLATAWLARTTVGAVLTKVGHPGATLDDAYIHFQYARAFAEGHPFRYQAGEPVSSGATSFTWPLVLAPFHALGLRGNDLVWVAWTFGFVALGALAYEAARLARPLVGGAVALGTGAATLLSGGLVWSAASGMEVVPFAWLLVSSLRRGAEWAEAPPGERTTRRASVLLAFAILTPLTRPEGSLVALCLGLAVVVAPVVGRRANASYAALFLVAALLPQVVLLLLTGSARSSTAEVKLLFGHPYGSAWEATLANVRLLFGTLLEGEVWAEEFVPRGGSALALLGLGAALWRGRRTGRPMRGAFIVVLALGMLVPCAYVTFLWNRLRYLWPFAPGFVIGLGCLARVVGEAARRARLPVAGAVPALLMGGVAGLFAAKLEGVIADVAASASGIDRQQVALGHWVRDALPTGARVGVNDTGAIAYFGDHKTFDVVGLTTPGEGRYWVAGPASRFEHYERLGKSRPESLPTHFVVYPEWMACEPVLGAALHEATVHDATILGGQTMRAHEARWTVLGSGDAPSTTHRTVLDEVDVADLESEDAHGFALDGARDGEQTVDEIVAASGRPLVDGGRTHRSVDRFVVRLGARFPVDAPLRLVARLAVAESTQIEVRMGGARAEVRALEAGPMGEIVVDAPEGLANDIAVEVRARDARTFASFHYWLVSSAGKPPG